LDSEQKKRELKSRW